MRVYKYHLSTDDVELSLPLGAEILKVEMQGGHLMLWALVDAEEMVRINRQFIVRSTGEEGIGLSDQHINTVFDGDHVWHVFERY